MPYSNNSGYISDEVDIDWKGEILNNNYICLSKLGFGGYSSVWLSYDVKNNNCVAIKIFNSDSYDDGNKEVQNLKKIHNLKSPYSINYLDNFETQYNDNIHYCVVLELMQSSLYSYRKKNNISLAEIKIISKQVLEFLQVLHRNNLVHTDIKPENILINNNLPIVNELTKFIKSNDYEKQLFIKKKALLNLKKYNIKYVHLYAIRDLLLDKFFNTNDTQTDSSTEDTDDADNDSSNIDSKYIFNRDMLFDNDNDTVTDEHESVSDTNNFDINNKDVKINKIKVSDFSTCIEINNPTYEIQTRYYRSPEIILETHFSDKLDVWSFGCMLYELLTGEILLNPDDIEDFSEDRYHIYLIHKKIDIFDIDMWNNSKKKYIYLDSENLLKGFNKYNATPFWNDLIQTYGQTDELLIFIDFLMHCLVINPVNRPSVQNLLSHSFLL